MRCILLAITLILGASTVLLAADGPDPVHVAPDEQAIEKTIDELGDADFQTRKAATEKLEGYGPEVVPMLQKYREHDDPEIRARINKVMRSFGWMEKGAIITRINKGSNAQKLGLHTGDVVVKIDDVDIVKHEQVVKMREDKEVTAYVWRAGKVLKVQVPKGTWGVILSNWDIAKGGNDHARGLSLLLSTSPNFAEAYRRLKSAHAQGMNDVHTIIILAGLAARAMDFEYANECYQGVSPAIGCGMTHWMTDGMPLNVPVASPHTAWLLNRYANEPLTHQLSHDLEDWFCKTGRNSPMLAEVLARPRDGFQEATFDRYHEMAASKLALSQRRYSEAIIPTRRAWDRIKHRDGVGSDLTFAYSDVSVVVMQAAIRSGDSETAARLGLDMLQDHTLDRNGKLAPPLALWGLASAAANGDQPAVDAYFDRLPKFTPLQARAVFRTPSLDAMYLPVAREAVLKYLEPRKSSSNAGRFRQVGLAALIADPASTPERFDEYTKGFNPANVNESYALTMLTGTLRFGQYERATAYIDALAKRYPDKYQFARDAAKRVIGFAAEYADQLSGDWKDLNGAIQVVDQPDNKQIFVMRYDGQVFRIRRDETGGKMETFEGLPIPPSPVSTAYSHFLLRPGGTVMALYPFGREMPTNPGPIKRTLVYVLSPKSTQWLPLADFKEPMGPVRRGEVLHALADQKVAKTHGKVPGNTQRDYTLMDQGFMWYEGDILVHVDGKTGKIRDLSAEIGKLAGREKPALVYQPEEHFDTRWVLFSDCGAWFFDTRDGSIKRIELGLKDENVITCSLPKEQFGKPGDNIYIAVAPQHGGKIFIFDPWIGLPKATNGYNGFGPNDWFAVQSRKWHYADPQETIYAQYIARMAKK